MHYSSGLFLASFVIAAAGTAAAQSPQVGDIVAPAPRVVDITPDDAVRVERYVREERDIPLVEEHMTLRPGSIIPEGVTLRVFPKDTELSRFAYFVSVDNKIVIADPHTREVVRIIDKKS